MTETAEHFTDRAAAFAAVLDAADGQWDRPTPCSDWTVRDVVAHAIETERDFLARHGFEIGEAPDLAEPAAAWRAHAAAVAHLLAQDGVADREYAGFFGPTTIGATMADFYGWDLVIHGSDVARATDQTWVIDDHEAASLQTTADAWGDSLYAEGICSRPVPVADDASATDRLLARLGRDPAWRPQPLATS